MSEKQILLGAGCFWGVEDYFRKVDGVLDVSVGYSGGQKSEPTYKEVCGGGTGHAEVALVKYDEEKINTEELLNHFWMMHDPTQLNQQGPDIGDQYRSAIFYFEDDQRLAAETTKEMRQQYLDKKIVTQILPAEQFWEAEEYHQNYTAKQK